MLNDKAELINVGVDLQFIEALRMRGEKIGFAESCTGGLLSALVVREAGVSDVFSGSIVSYSYESKTKVLGVDAKELALRGAVSEAVVRQMAAGALRALNVNWSVAITGVAGPGGGTPEKPIGTVWFCVMGPSVDHCEAMSFEGGRNQIQQQSVEFAVRLLNLAIGAANSPTAKRITA